MRCYRIAFLHGTLAKQYNEDLVLNREKALRAKLSVERDRRGEAKELVVVSALVKRADGYWRVVEVERGRSAEE